MSTEILYHGTNGDNVLGILAARAILPGADFKIYFSPHRWESALMHGGDRRRMASFVIKVRVEVPNDVVRTREVTAGVPDALAFHTRKPLQADVLELHVRKPVDGGFQFEHVVGAAAIKALLSRI